jgi:hypothetical protein
MRLLASMYAELFRAICKASLQRPNGADFGKNSAQKL